MGRVLPSRGAFGTDFPFSSIIPMPQLPDLEAVAEKVHEAWMQTKQAQGVTSRQSETGEELMVPYAQLSEPAKELDRMTVRTVYAAIEAVGS
jgi:hypothetical protein